MAALPLKQEWQHFFFLKPLEASLHKHVKIARLAHSETCNTIILNAWNWTDQCEWDLVCDWACLLWCWWHWVWSFGFQRLQFSWFILSDGFNCSVEWWNQPIPCACHRGISFHIHELKKSMQNTLQCIHYKMATEQKKDITAIHTCPLVITALC